MPVDWSKILDAAGDFGQVAGAAAGGRAQGRLAEAGANMGGANLDLARKKYNNAAPSLYTSQNLVSDLLQNAGDFKLNAPGITTNTAGGIRPSAIGQNTKDAAAGLASTARTKMAELPKSNASGGGQYFGNAPDLMPQPNAMDKILSTAGTLSSALPIVKSFLPKAAAAGASAMIPAGTPAAASAAGATGGVGSTIGGLLTNPITLAAGAGLGIAYAIKKHQNATKGDRNDFAKDAGFSDLARLNDYLRSLGPAGQAAASYGDNVVGKHNKQQNQQWMQMVQQAMSGHA